MTSTAIFPGVMATGISPARCSQSRRQMPSSSPLAVAGSCLNSLTPGPDTLSVFESRPGPAGEPSLL